VFVWRHPELSVTMQVRPDGKISTPHVEDMVAAAGKTAPQLGHDIEKVMSEHVPAPKVSIIVNAAADGFSWVKVVGQVACPRALAYSKSMRVLDAIRAVGGLTQLASGNDARIVRVEDGKETIIHVNVADLVNGGDVEHNTLLKPDDVLVVPQFKK
jgi:polysaccharide export outer membrane protein